VDGWRLTTLFPRRYNLGVTLEKSDVEGSITSFERAVRLDPTFFHSYYALLEMCAEMTSPR
jgi:hypothetical protein